MVLVFQNFGLMILVLVLVFKIFKFGFVYRNINQTPEGCTVHANDITIVPAEPEKPHQSLLTLKERKLLSLLQRTIKFKKCKRLIKHLLIKFNLA